MRAVVYTLFGASFTIATAWALGALLLKRVTVSLSRLEAWLIAVATGSACLSAIVFGLCTANLARKGVYLGFGLLMIAMGVRYSSRPSRGEGFPTLRPAWRGLFVAVFLAGMAMYFRNVVAAELMPAATPDRLSVLDRQHGFKGLTDLSVQLPEGLGLLLLPAFAFGRHPAAVLVDFAFFGSLLLLMLCYGRRIGRPLAGVGGAILIYASTMIGRNTFAGGLVAVLYLLLVRYHDRVSAALLAAKGMASACIVYGTEHSHLVRAIGGITIAAMFLWFARPGLAYYFDTDDIANLGIAGSQPLHKFLLDSVPILGSPSRAFGLMIYRGLYALVGLHPLPYHLFSLALLATNIYLLYRLAFALTESKTTAMLAALLGCFHSRMESLYTSIANLFDIGSCTFFLLALLYYLRLRNDGRHAGLMDHLILVALYLSALNFKEMAATLPVVLVCYELIYWGRLRFQVSELRRWIPIGTLAVITGAYLLRDLVGKSGLTEAYHPQYSLQRFLETWQVYMGYLFYLLVPFPLTPMLMLCALLLAVALLMRSRPLIFCWCFLMITPLPVSFIELRGLNVWYIPFAGWAIYAAALIQTLFHKLLPSPSKFRAFATAVLFLTLGALVAVAHNRQRAYTFSGNAGSDQTIKQFVTQFAVLDPHLPPGSRTLFLNDPFAANTWTPVFLLRLYFRDPSLEIQRVKIRGDQDVIAVSSYDFVFDYRGDQLVLVSSHRVSPQEVRVLIDNHLTQ